MSVRAGQEYISSFTLKATQQTMNVVCTLLRFDITELWKKEDGRYICVYIHVEDIVRRMNPNIIAADSFYPNDSREHVLSPRLCDLAKASPNRYHWKVADPNSAAESRSGKPCLYPEQSSDIYPYQTEMAYRVDCGVADVDIFIVGFSFSSIICNSSRLNFLAVVSSAVYLAAFDLDDDNEVPATSPSAVAIRSSSVAVNAARRRELDEEASLHVVSPAYSDARAFEEVDHSRKFIYPISDIPLLRPVPVVSFYDIKGIRHIADGSHSNVFAGTLGRDKVAVKMIKEESIADPVAKHEYDMELDILSRINHPNIVRLIGQGTIPRRFLVLEYLGAGSLSSILEKNEMKSKFHFYILFNYLSALRTINLYC